MNNFDQKWTKLVALARQAPDDRETAAPYGFATRVAARALAAPAAPWAIFERFTGRALLVASLLMVASLAANYSALASGEDDEQAGVLDPVAEILDVS